MHPSISVGITVYKRLSFLKECILSIIQQPYDNIEVIIGNDDPENRLTLAYLGIDDNRVRIINRDANIGEIPNMNDLLHVAKGQYFTWLADDDAWSPQFLDQISKAILDFDNPVCIYTHFIEGETFPHVHQTENIDREILTGQKFLSQYLSRKLKVIGCYGVYQTSYLRKIGGMQLMSKRFGPYSDTMMTIRAGLLTEIILIKSPLVFYRIHGDSASIKSEDVLGYKESQETLCKNSIKIFKEQHLLKDFDTNLYQLLSFWCIGYWHSVLARSDKLHYSQWRNYYFKFVYSYAVQLNRYRWLVLYDILKGLYVVLKSRVKLVMGLRKIYNNE